MKTWMQVANSNDVMLNGGGCVLLGGVQIALFKVQKPGGLLEWYAVQGESTAAHPLHENAFSLRTSEHLGGASSQPDWTLETFFVKEIEGLIFVEKTERSLAPTGAGHEPYAHSPDWSGKTAFGPPHRGCRRPPFH